MSAREPREPLDPLSADQLAAVSELWGRTGREVLVRFTGSSMAPAIPTGSEVRMICGSGGAVGEVVAVRTGGTVIVHRVVARSAAGGWILTRGDARWLPDVPMRGPEAILGRVTERRRGDSFEVLPPPPSSILRTAALTPLVALLRVSPRAGTALIVLLLRLRRLLLNAVGALGRVSPPAG